METKQKISIKISNFATELQHYGSVAQLNRASDSGSAGHGFESHPSHQTLILIQRIKILM